MSVSENENKSAKATAINQSFWSSFSTLIVDALDQKRVNRRSRNSKGKLQVLRSLIGTTLTNLFYTKEGGLEQKL